MHLPGSHHRSSEQQQELRDARRLLRERIKDDWEYPTLPAWRSSGKKEPATEEDIEDKIAGFRFHTPSDHDREGPNASNGALGLSFNPMEWREREYSDLDASDTDGEPSPVKEEASASAKHKRSEYKFDGPDSVGAQLSERRHARKRRRQVRLQEEMEWNDGLAHWMRRRDIWCSARTVAEVRSHESPAEEDADADADADADSASTSSPRASTSSSAEEEEEEDGDQAADETPESTPSSTPDMTASTPPHVPPPSPMQVLVPIAPPLLPNHPIRRRINRNMYPEIYTKIILQSRTPSIPINLLTLIKALVQGWKDDGEWPPKNVPVEKSIGRKKAKDGLKEKMGRVLRFTGTGTGTGE
ncbi:hypothetical protein AC579_5057 [Pseudocercospora musae]|uniref:Gag1-like clamp domain-containing protein n=1 Tax=Pseudocercospora musae TaxID=113226 RepID=A0A139I7M1_9PEZI|nr:hypothetical protein AC579_5057 [Pseudocercospora musae]